jgi:hypothetical protein
MPAVLMSSVSAACLGIGNPGDSMEVEFHFSIDNSPQTFHQAVRLVIGFALSLDVSQRRPGQHAERSLIDDLIAGIQFRNDKMNGGSKAQHVMLISIFIWTKARKRWQQSMMQIDDSAAGELPAQLRREYSHVPSQHDIVDVLFVDDFLQN